VFFLIRIAVDVPHKVFGSMPAWHNVLIRLKLERYASVGNEQDTGQIALRSLGHPATTQDSLLAAGRALPDS
jgi:hypothetical protein